MVLRDTQAKQSIKQSSVHCTVLNIQVDLHFYLTHKFTSMQQALGETKSIQRKL
jgi:hypothetical protein